MPLYICSSAQYQEQLQPCWKIYSKVIIGEFFQQNYLTVLSASKIGHTSSFVILLFLISGRNEGSTKVALLNSSAAYENSDSPLCQECPFLHTWLFLTTYYLFASMDMRRSVWSDTIYIRRRWDEMVAKNYGRSLLFFLWRGKRSA